MLCSCPSARCTSVPQRAQYHSKPSTSPAGRAQFLVSTHSPIILAYPDAVLLSLDGDAIRPVEYMDTEHYRLTKQFLISPEPYFKHLFSEDSDDGEES